MVKKTIKKTKKQYTQKQKQRQSINIKIDQSKKIVRSNKPAPVRQQAPQSLNLSMPSYSYLPQQQQPANAQNLDSLILSMSKVFEKKKEGQPQPQPVPIPLELEPQSYNDNHYDLITPQKISFPSSSSSSSSYENRKKSRDELRQEMDKLQNLISDSIKKNKPIEEEKQPIEEEKQPIEEEKQPIEEEKQPIQLINENSFYPTKYQHMGFDIYLKEGSKALFYKTRNGTIRHVSSNKAISKNVLDLRKQIFGT